MRGKLLNGQLLLQYDTNAISTLAAVKLLKPRLPSLDMNAKMVLLQKTYTQKAYTQKTYTQKT